MSKIRAFVVRLQDEPAVEEIENDLATFQKLVGGYVEIINLGHGLSLWCNESGALEKLPLNRGVVCYSEGVHTGAHFIRGTFFVTRYDAHGDAASISEGDARALRLRLWDCR